MAWELIRESIVRTIAISITYAVLEAYKERGLRGRKASPL
jgi:hypothetical protein